MWSKSCFRLSQQDREKTASKREREREWEWEWGSSSSSCKRKPVPLNTKHTQSFWKHLYLLKRHLERQKETFHTTCAQKLTPGEDFESTFDLSLNSQRGVAPDSKKGPYLPNSKEVTRYPMNISHRTARCGLPPAAPRYCICSWACKANKCTHTHTHTHTHTLPPTPQPSPRYLLEGSPCTPLPADN